MYPFQQHHLHQVNQRASGCQRAPSHPGIPGGVYPGIPELQHRDEALVSGVHDSVAAQPYQVTLGVGVSKILKLKF